MLAVAAGVDDDQPFRGAEEDAVAVGLAARGDLAADQVNAGHQLGRGRRGGGDGRRGREDQTESEGEGHGDSCSSAGEGRTV